MMAAGLKKLRLGTCVCYLLPTEDGGWVLVDAGNRGWERHFARRLRRLKIEPTDIRLIVLTHTHFDHVGSLAAIKGLCGCPVAVHTSEAERLAAGRADIPPGNRPWSKFLVRHAHLAQPCWPWFKGVDPDVLIEEDTNLENWGLEARLLQTPGHTSGSLSILTPQGDAIVGDLCVYGPPVTGRWVLPPFAEHTAEIPLSWQKILAAGAKMIHPAHAVSFSASRLSRETGLRLNGIIASQHHL